MSGMSDGGKKERRRGPGVPWVPGVSGNPSGRPKTTISRTLAKLLGEKAPGEGFTNEEAICRKIVELCRSGDKDMIDFLFTRLEGRPIAVTPDGEGVVPGYFTIRLGDGAPE